MAFDPTDNPVNAHQTVLNQGDVEPGFQNCGPLITAERVKDEYLFGIPLKAPLTNQELSDASIKQFIRKAVGDFETSVRIPVTPVRITDRMDFDMANDGNFSTRQLTRFPLLQVEKLEALFPGQTEGNGYGYPTSWVTPLADSGLIRLVPNNDNLTDSDGNPFATIGGNMLRLGRMHQWPNLWRVTYTAGFDFDKVPDIVNDLIGTMAALRILGMIGPAIFPINSFGIGLDGLSQSTGNAGPNWLQERVGELSAERDRMIAQLKIHYGTNITFQVW